MSWTDWPLSAVGGRDADDPVEGGLGDVEGALAIDHDAARIAQFAGQGGHLAGRGDPEDLADVEPAADEHAPIGPHRQVRPMVVSTGQPGDEVKLTVGAEPEHLPDGAQQDEVVARRRRDADEPPQGFLAGGDGPAPREERRKGFPVYPKCL